MAMRIRCSECSKKISIDEGFAGGVCRCPYCKALVVVGGGPMQTVGSRPEAPTERPEAPAARPEAPGAAEPAPAPAEAAAPAHIAPEHIPMARPVKVQGIVAIVLLGLMIVFLVGGGYLLYIALQNTERDNSRPFVPPKPTPSAANPLNATGPNQVAGIAIKSPVVYVVDYSGKMDEFRSVAADLVKRSLVSLKDGKYNVVLALDQEGPRPMAAQFSAAGDGNAAKEFIEGMFTGGSSKLEDSVQKALEFKPATVVVFATTSKRFESDQVAGTLAAAAKKQGTTIDTIVLGDPEQTNAHLKNLAEQTGGKMLAYQP